MNTKMKVEVNSGGALVMYTVSFFALNFMAAFFSPIVQLYPVALGGLTGAFAGFLVKRNSNNKITLEAEKAGVVATRKDPLT